MLDTTYLIETPEGSTLELHPAGPVVRSCAWLIDFIIRAIIYSALTYYLSLLNDFGTGLLLISIFLLEWFYPVLFEVYSQGATPGKKLLKIRVLNELGTPVNWNNSLIRNLLRTIDFLPIGYGFGLLTMLSNPTFKRIGDLAAGTIVAYQENTIQRPSLPDTTTSQHLPVPLTFGEQQALLDFAERTFTLTMDRKIELANLLTPLTHQTDHTAIVTLYQFAQGLLGKNPPIE